jgi:hypothetical protein
MFESIKGALEKTAKSSGYRDLMKLEAGKTYVVRLVPNRKNPGDTFYHYFHQGWKSVVTGQYVSAISPSTWEERCLISEEYFKLWREADAAKDDAGKERAKLLKRKESWYVNVFVIEDPTTPENVGKVKILRFGAQIKKIIDSAVGGEDAEEFGPRIFDLTDEGCNFRIKPEKNGDSKRGGDFNVQYTASKFLRPSALPGVTDEKIEEIYNSIHDLMAIDTKSSTEDIQKMLRVHFYGQEDGEETTSTKTTKSSNNALAEAAAKGASKKPVAKETPPEDEIDMTPKSTKKETKETSKPTTVSVDDDAALDQLLDGLGEGK